MTKTIDGTELDRLDILDLLTEFNADAKTFSRRGYVGTRSADYAVCHEAVNDCLDALGY